MVLFMGRMFIQGPDPRGGGGGGVAAQGERERRGPGDQRRRHAREGWMEPALLELRPPHLLELPCAQVCYSSLLY